MSLSLPRQLAIVLVVLSLHDAAAQAYRVDTLARAPYAQYPECIAFPRHGDGPFFFTEKNSGRVRVFNGTLQPRTLLTVPVETDGPQGLLGITFSPSYPDTPYFYVFYVRSPDRLGIIERYRDSTGTAVDPTLIAIVPRRDEATGNNGGILGFGPDGKLYITVGDHQTHPEFAQDTSSRHVPWGKILRLNPDGSYPADNPNLFKPFWAIGLRNGQGMTFDAGTGDLYVAEGGSAVPNKIFRVRKGDNLGWPKAVREGDARQAHPLVEFSADRAPDLTGIALYRGDAFPALRGKLLVAGNAVPAVWTGTFVRGGDSVMIEKFYSFPTGFADLQVGPDGCIYLTNGPYLSSKILRISPVPPSFTSSPPPDAVQDVRFTYTPTFTGTPPEVALLSGPDGMTLHHGTGTIEWVPTNAQALQRRQTFAIRARNGAGTVIQRVTLDMINVNDPPTEFRLGMPASGSSISFFGRDPEVMLTWERSNDPDGDSIRYTVEIDTAASFGSPAVRTMDAGDADSLRVTFPRVSQTYFWRVAATDGRFTTYGAPGAARISLSVTSAVAAQPKVVHEPVATPPEPAYVSAFTPSTHLSYTLERAGQVRIVVFNILGQEVLRVFDGMQPEGTYQVDLAKLGLPNGMYFYRLQGPGIFETKKMVLSR